MQVSYYFSYLVIDLFMFFVGRNGDDAFLEANVIYGDLHQTHGAKVHCARLLRERLCSQPV